MFSFLKLLLFFLFSVFLAFDCFIFLENLNQVRRATPEYEKALKNTSSGIAVVLPVYKRPERLKKTLAKLSECSGSRGVVYIISEDQDYTISNQLDAILSDFAHSVKPAPVLILRHRKDFLSLLSPNIALGRNIQFALDFAFGSPRLFPEEKHQSNMAKISIVVEDDVELTRDALKYFIWIMKNLDTRLDNFFTASAYNHTGVPKANLNGVYWSSFNTWGWSISRRSYFRYMHDNWTPGSNWDLEFKILQDQLQLLVASPPQSRSFHTGTNGVNFKSKFPELHMDPAWGRIFAAQPKDYNLYNYYPQQFGKCSHNRRNPFGSDTGATDTCNVPNYSRPTWYIFLQIVSPFRTYYGAKLLQIFSKLYKN
eukprot:g404.t1